MLLDVDNALSVCDSSIELLSIKEHYAASMSWQFLSSNMLTLCFSTPYKVQQSCIAELAVAS
jgi:hypothetical protein